MQFEDLKRQYLAGILSDTSHQVRSTRLSEFPDSLLCWAEHIDDMAKGHGVQVLRQNRFARLILNGGMATRFGGRVKGICEVYEGKTFLELKVWHMSQVEKRLQLPEIPIVLMNSPATHEATLSYLKENDFFGRKNLTLFVQETYPRLTPVGELFTHEDQGKCEAPRGHGDFLEGLFESGTFTSWGDQGITHFDFSNIDNLGATVDPALVGEFVKSKSAMAVELARKNPGDKGGAACCRDDVPGVLEGIYFDGDFDQDRLPWFNTNNLMFSMKEVDSLYRDEAFAFPWNVVSKEVDGQKVLQFERIAIDALWGFNQRPDDRNVLFLAVDRSGKRGRFYPVKSPDDLNSLQDELKQRLEG